MTVIDNLEQLDRVLTEDDEPALPCDGPCDPTGEAAWWFKAQACTKCDPEDIQIALLCTPCKELALSPITYGPCTDCGGYLRIVDHIIDWGPL